MRNEVANYNRLIQLGMHQDREEHSAKNYVEPVDDLKQLRRDKLANLINQRFEELSLRERLAKTKSETSDILREGLLGFLPDDTLLKDIYPQGKGFLVSDKISNDSLWKQMIDFLPMKQKENIIALFEAIEEFAPKLEDENQKEGRAKFFGHDHLITIGDVRQFTLEGWKKMNNLGKGRANLIFEAARKT
jgi:hypothetical protein